MSQSCAQSIYIHLPFCKTKCPYCDFASFAGKNNLIESYQCALHNEIEFRLGNFFANRKSDKPNLKTIFFGGGTPSIHDASFFAALFDQLRKFFVFDKSIEITLEANPGTISADKLASFKAAGINRISIGVQTFNERLLEKLGRGHSLQDTFRSIQDIQNVGFDNWSMDLIYGLPHQQLADWKHDLQTCVSFGPPHVSAYALSIEKNTPYGDIYKNSSHADLPQEDTLVEMYDQVESVLAGAGLPKYEVSNWAKLGYEARHNLCYWQAQEYFAFGISAHGYLDSYRYANTRDLNKYLSLFLEQIPESKNCFEYCEELTSIDENEKLQEKIMLNLRLSRGLELDAALRKKLNEKKIKYFIDNGFLTLDSSGPNTPELIALTHKGLLLSNKIISELLP